MAEKKFTSVFRTVKHFKKHKLHIIACTRNVYKEYSRNDRHIERPNWSELYPLLIGYKGWLLTDVTLHC